MEYQILSVFRCTTSQEEARVGQLIGQESCQNVSDLSADQREDLNARFDDPGCEQARDRPANQDLYAKLRQPPHPMHR